MFHALLRKPPTAIAALCVKRILAPSPSAALPSGVTGGYSTFADWFPDALRELAPELPDARVDHRPFGRHREPCAVWNDVLLPHEVAAVQRAAEAVWELEAEAANVFSDILQPTRWYPCTSQAPRNAIERAIQTLRLEVLGLGEEEGLLGCEWWVQRVPAGGDLPFHFDKDECAAAGRQGHRLLHPGLSSVVYLSAGGGPTAVLEWSVGPDPQHREGLTLLDAAPGALHLVPPHLNSFLAFQGNLLHGVVAPAGPAAAAAPSVAEPGSHRLTLLVNWWQRVPEAPCCSPLPAPMLQRLAALDQGSPGPSPGPPASARPPPARAQRSPLDAREVPCGEVEVPAPPHLGLGVPVLQTLRVPMVDLPPGALVTVSHAYHTAHE